ncbi:MAG: hypothetical protein J7647_05510 [Cyanobacteria bacterium SBLK]|nr:hypothetical protein [Cyanobacteria bacterium SBLK]
MKDYAYKGLRWYWDGEIWRKKEMSVVADYSLCEYFQQPARIGIVKTEEELRRFAD